MEELEKKNWYNGFLLQIFRREYNDITEINNKHIIMIKISKRYDDEGYSIRLASERDSFLTPNGVQFPFTDSLRNMAEWVLTIRNLMQDEDGSMRFAPWAYLRDVEGEHTVLIEDTKRDGCVQRIDKYTSDASYIAGGLNARQMWDKWCKEAEEIIFAPDDDESQS